MQRLPTERIQRCQSAPIKVLVPIWSTTASTLLCLVMKQRSAARDVKLELSEWFRSLISLFNFICCWDHAARFLRTSTGGISAIAMLQADQYMLLHIMGWRNQWLMPTARCLNVVSRTHLVRNPATSAREIFSLSRRSPVGMSTL